MIDQGKQAEAAAPVLAEDVMLMTQLPFIFFCDWWSTALQSFSHSCGPRHPAGSGEDEGQLVVPEPIEVEGEHMFA